MLRASATGTHEPLAAATWCSARSCPAAGSGAHAPESDVQVWPAKLTRSTPSDADLPTSHVAIVHPLAAGWGPLSFVVPSSFSAAAATSAGPVKVRSRQVSAAGNWPLNADANARACDSHWAYASGAAERCTDCAASVIGIVSQPGSLASRW